MMGERVREERKGGRRQGEKERVGSCSRVKGCYGDSTAERVREGWSDLWKEK